jgi:hypothetical protein
VGVHKVKVLVRIHMAARAARNQLGGPGASSSEISPCDCAEGISRPGCACAVNFTSRRRVALYCYSCGRLAGPP